MTNRKTTIALASLIWPALQLTKLVDAAKAGNDVASSDFLRGSRYPHRRQGEIADADEAAVGGNIVESTVEIADADEAGVGGKIVESTVEIIETPAELIKPNYRYSGETVETITPYYASDSGDAIDTDYYAIDTGINPDSGDEDYTIQDWVEDPSTDETIEVDAYVYNNNTNSTVYQYNYTGPLLEEPGNDLGEGMLNVCQGDCDYDLDCAEGLVCWYDDGSLKVPGCSGTARLYWEYCIDPGALPDTNVTHSDTLVDFGNDLGAVSLGHCQGDCDYDIDCVGDDVCFFADGTGIVPGCDGAPSRGWEYCADPQVIKEHRAKIGLENLNSTDGYCPASVPYEGRVEVGSVNGTLANEVSGMVNGRRNPNVLYVHNDRNNAPRLMAIHKNNGRMVGNWNLGGINHTDYEDISNGPGPKPGVNYLHLCDIGDNPYDRTAIEIHRLPEPALTGPIGPKTFYPQTLTLRYPDGPMNAEACLVDPLTGLIYIMQKTRGTSHIYRTAAPWGDGDETMNLMLAGTVSNLRKPARWGNALTGIDISPNGRDIVMLYYGGLDYRCRDANESVEDALGRFGLLLPAYVEEPQGGEAIAFSTDMTGLYSCQESGGWSEVPLYRYPATISGLLEGRSSAATPFPSASPVSISPTRNPSASPVSNNPTQKPNAVPTSSPIASPISNPPTNPPTVFPSSAPISDTPTRKPSSSPVSNSPTQTPSAAKDLLTAEEERIKDEEKNNEILTRTEEDPKGEVEKKSGGSEPAKAGAGPSKSGGSGPAKAGAGPPKSGGSGPAKAGAGPPSGGGPSEPAKAGDGPSNGGGPSEPAKAGDGPPKSGGGPSEPAKTGAGPSKSGGGPSEPAKTGDGPPKSGGGPGEPAKGGAGPWGGSKPGEPAKGGAGPWGGSKPGEPAKAGAGPWGGSKPGEPGKSGPSSGRSEPHRRSSSRSSF